MRILITGSNGFIGSNLVNFLEKNISKKKITIITKKNNIISKLYWDNLPKVDLIIHLASKSNIKDSWSNTAEYIDNNVIGTIKVLDYCKKHKVKLIFFSSYLYFGDKYIKSKETDPITCNNPYALSKKNSEEWCNFYAKNYKINIVILRLFNIYGKFQNTKSFIASIIFQLKKNKKIFINKTIYRDYLHVDDLNNLILKIIKKYKQIKGLEIYNVGYGKASNLFKITNLLKKNINSSSEIRNCTKVEKNQIIYTKANITKVCNKFKWKPNIDIKMGLNKICL